ncbi:hypothetical protein [Zavarzinella formosa]|nr:hypothetical protein [Zavarzinella formosa]
MKLTPETRKRLMAAFRAFCEKRDKAVSPPPPPPKKPDDKG